MVFSLNGMGINDIIKIKELVNRFGVPCWSFMVDHPYCHHTRLINKVYNQIVSVIDRKHLEYLKQYYPNIKYKLFLPHGGTCSECACIKFDDKKYDLSFFGSYEAADGFLDKLGNYSEDLQKIFIKIAEDVWTGREVTLEDSFRHNMAQHKINVGEDEVAEFMFELDFLDTYLRFKRRSLLIETTLRSGRKVHVFGKGWENFQCSNSQNLVVHGEADYKTSLDIMADSKVVLNNMPLFADGSHERVFSIISIRKHMFDRCQSIFEGNIYSWGGLILL